ncbi:hypothetical protein AJ79_02507 [Helicocarpus griseus UAMH5409]|uniref:Rhodopsin domain-containing protein n=1 Tax=Helicocarpus griseus UAMH5409 TaxID=1447875 RepID=A0A2B7Y2Q6_9EURO|nr:hypothetical protein AJ79_02507 [Helicocarpus griseus UAMH5409]
MDTPIQPAGKPPAGVTSNFVNPPYDGTRFAVVNAVFMPLAVIAVLIRIWTRFAITRAGGLDDYLMVFAVLCSVVITGLTVTMLHYGLAKHMWDVPITDFSPHFLLLNLLSAMLYCAGIGATKVSCLLLYLRIFPTKKFQIAVWAIIAVAASYSIASVFANLFSCSPVAKSWDVSILRGHCMDRPRFYFANAALGIITDFATVLAPMPLIRGLQLPLRQKVMLAGILVMGGCVCIVSIFRLVTISALQKSSDLTYATTDALLWCIIELNLGIVGGSFPALRPFFRQYFPGFLGGTSGRHTSRSYGYSRHQSNSNFRHSHKLASLQSSSIHTPTKGEFPIGANDSNIYSSTVGVGQTDNDSEEHIIDSRSPPFESQMGHIIKTVEYDLKVT